MIPEQNIQSFNFNVPPGKIPQLIKSEHSQAITCVCVNQLKDLLVTCGQDGEVHLYRLFQSQNSDGLIQQPEKIGYCAVFDDPIICADWGRNYNRPYIAVGSAKGEIAILRVYPKTNIITIDQKIQLNNIACTQIVWAMNKRAFLVATSQKLCYEVVFNQKWEKLSSKQLLNQSPISVAYNPNNEMQVLVGNQNSISLNQIVGEGRFKEIWCEKVGKFDILRILYSNQYPAELNQFIILTQDRILVADDINAKNISQSPVKLSYVNIRQQINLTKMQLEIVDISWGNDQTQILCYESFNKKKQPEQSHDIRDLIIKPKRMTLDLCGQWSLEASTQKN